MRRALLPWPILFLAACGGGVDAISGSGGAGGAAVDAGGAGGSVASYGSLSLRGVNLAGADFGSTVPGTFGTDYMYPDSHYAAGYDSPAYYRAKKMTVFRLPFLWERLQPAPAQPFDTAEAARLDTTVTDLLATGASVILDPHNYARRGGETIGSAGVPISAFADLWSRLAGKYGASANVVFGLMNEPHDIDDATWVAAAQAAVTAIRQAGAGNLILVPANGWTNAATWSLFADPLLAIQDPAGNLAFEAHNYFNAAASNSDTCVSASIGVERLQGFTAWLEAHGRKGFIGELSGNAADATCASTVQNMLQHVQDHAAVYLGWAWWAGGPWWGDSFNSLEPSSGADDPKLAWLTPFL